MKPQRRGLSRIWHATQYSLQGIRAAWRSEAAFRQECLLGVVLVPLAFWWGRDPLEWGLLLGAYLLILMIELINSAIEAITDRIGTDRHELAGRAKDMGSAAVLISLVIFGLVWISVAADRWWL